MSLGLEIADLIVILAFLGLIIAFGAVVFAVLTLKNGVMRNAKRIYERPTRSAKNLATAVKGIIQQESVRVVHAADNARHIADVVGKTALETKEALETMRDLDWEPLIAVAQSGTKFAAAAASVAQAASRQRA
jgi:hypothetical protein